MSKPTTPPKNNGRPVASKGTLPRVIRLLFQFYPKLVPVVIFCIIFAAIVNAIPSIFTQKVLAVITESLDNGTPLAEAMPQILPLIGVLVGLYVVSILLITLQSQLMAYITQSFLSKMRCKMFDGMQLLPIKYFDTHKHGDIMNHDAQGAYKRQKNQSRRYTSSRVSVSALPTGGALYSLRSTMERSNLFAALFGTSGSRRAAMAFSSVMIRSV